MRFLISMILVVPAAALADSPKPNEPRATMSVPTIEVTDLSISGGIDKAVVARVYGEGERATRSCVDKADPAKVTGTLTVKFRIDAKGAPINVTATGVAAVNACVVTAIKALAFAGPSKPVDVTEKVALHSGTAGILGAMTVQQGGAFASLTGTGDSDDVNIYGGLLGNEAGEMNGGSGTAVLGPGGGGTGWGTIGTGRKAGLPSVADGDPTASGDKEAIRRAVKGALAPIRFCYEHELLADRKLAGTVAVKFRVEADGNVSSATGSGLAKVDVCVAKAIAAIKFARTTTGAPIDVSYPFVFKADAGGIGVGSSNGRSAVPTVAIGQPNAQGDLDKAIIRRYIKRNIQKIQYCYEKQLLNKPGLAGTVQSSFTIGVDGMVSSSTASGLRDVDTCVAAVIQQIEFPKPKNNGVVQVNYPFVFSPGDDDKH